MSGEEADKRHSHGPVQRNMLTKENYNAMQRKEDNLSWLVNQDQN